MTNHIDLPATPTDIGAILRMMYAVGRGYVGCFNTHDRRNGTWWEGRFKVTGPPTTNSTSPEPA